MTSTAAVPRSIRRHRLRQFAPMRARLARQQLMQLARAKIETVVRADDADAQMTERELPSLLEIARIVESHRVPSIDEGDTSRADHLADAALDDERGVLVDAQPEQRRVRRDDEKQALQPAPLREVRVDDRVEAEQAESGADVLFDEVALLVDLPAGHRELAQR